jgi:hypothetical protein
MMNLVYDIGINLASAGIGAGAGVGWAYGRNRFRYRHHREFWRFLEKPTILVVGGLEMDVLLGTLPDALEQVVNTQQDREKIFETIMNHLSTQESSGLMGRGDLNAIVSMMAKVASLPLSPKPSVLHASQVRGQRVENLILVGGNDSNPLTKLLVPGLGCRLESVTNDEGRNVIRDTRLNVDYPVTWQNEPNDEGEVHWTDYGILARGPNPFNPDHDVLLIAGAHGWGSLAAAEICISPKFEKRLYNDFKQYRGRFECLVSYRRVDGGPSDGHVTIDLEFSRALDPPPVQH